jgi:hypothetical protein
MKKQDMIDSLLALGVKRGMLTWRELNDAFPAEFFPLEELERFLGLLEELGVKVVDPGEKRKKRTHHSHSEYRRQGR